MKRTEPDDRFWSDGSDMTIIEPKKSLAARFIEGLAQVVQNLILVGVVMWFVVRPIVDDTRKYFEAHFDAVDKKLEAIGIDTQDTRERLERKFPNPTREGLSSHDEQGRPFPIDGNYNDPRYQDMLKEWSKTHPQKDGGEGGGK